MKNRLRKLNILLLTGIAFMLFLSACQKNRDTDDDTSAAKNENTAENYFSELSSIADQVATTGDLSGLKVSEDLGSLVSSCAIITIDTTANATAQNPNVYTVDFGSSCLGNDGKTRAGKIIISSSGPYFQAGTVVIITPENYSVNGNQISGTRTVTNLGENTSGQPSFSVVVSGTITLSNDGGTITWNANRVRTWTSGFNTPFLFLDDEYSLSGNSSGTKVNGLNWTSQINTSLVYRHSCRQTVSGTLTISPENRADRLVNFGSGECDYSASVTINGNTYTFNLL